MVAVCAKCFETYIFCAGCQSDFQEIMFELSINFIQFLSSQNLPVFVLFIQIIKKFLNFLITWWTVMQLGALTPGNFFVNFMSRWWEFVAFINENSLIQLCLWNEWDDRASNNWTLENECQMWWRLWLIYLRRYFLWYSVAVLLATHDKVSCEKGLLH